jgi:hypothetical protein
VWAAHGAKAGKRALLQGVRPTWGVASEAAAACTHMAACRAAELSGVQG